MTIKIEYFSDVLCIWAYGGQIRMDELKRDFSEKVEIEYRFVPIFGAGKQHVLNVWKDKGDFEGFNQHLKQVADSWTHVTISSDLWTKVAPESSTAAHLYLKAIQLLTTQDEMANQPVSEFNGRTRFEQSIWLFRDAFFRQGRDVSSRKVQDEIAVELQLPVKDIHALIESGQAYAALHQDDEAKNKYQVPGSPTLVLNDGRQMLYGNVGYRIIDANVRELMHHPDHAEASWC